MADKPAWASAPGVTLLTHVKTGEVWVRGSERPLVALEYDFELLERGQHDCLQLQGHYDTSPVFDRVHYFTDNIDSACDLEMALLELFLLRGRLINNKWAGLR
jgi:hypothetical protein